MLTTGIQNLPEPLARAQAAYRDGTTRLARQARTGWPGGWSTSPRRSSSSWTTRTRPALVP